MHTWTVGRKIALTCATIVGFCLILGVSALYSVSRVNRITQTIVTDPLPSNYYAGRLNAGVKKMMVWMSIHIQSTDPAHKAKLEEKISKRDQQWRGEMQKAQALASSEEERNATNETLAAYERIIGTWQREILPLSRAGQQQQANALYLSKLDSGLEDLDRPINVLVNSNNAAGEKAGAEAQMLATRANAQIWIALLLCVSAGALLAAIVVRGTNRSLHAIIGELAEGSKQLSSAAHQVSASSQSLAQGASQQAASLEETSAATEQISATTQRNGENSVIAAELVGDTLQNFQRTNQSLREMVEAMGEIKSQSDKISKIIKVIDEIAFQTNLLALNAAVEAARAGEAGMGFAVVADEVRNLAQRCAQAAKDTESLIEESIHKANSGTAKVDEVAKAIENVTNESGKLGTIIDEVKSSSQEQLRGMHEIGKAISEIERVTERTAASAEESASAAEELDAQSEALKGVVGRLSEMVGVPRAVRAGTGLPTISRLQPKPKIASAKSVAAVPATPVRALVPTGAAALPMKINHRELPLDDDFGDF